MLLSEEAADLDVPDLDVPDKRNEIDNDEDKRIKKPLG